MAKEEMEALLQEVSQEVKKAMKKKTKLTPVLGELEATLLYLRNETVQLDDLSCTPDILVRELRNRAKLIAEVSKLRPWNYFKDPEDYKNTVLDFKKRVIDFDETLKHSHHLWKKLLAYKGRTVPLTEEEQLREHLREEFVATESALRVFLRLKDDKKEPSKIKNLVKVIQEATSHCLEMMDLLTTEELRNLVEEMIKWVEVVWRSRNSKTEDQCVALESLRKCLCHDRLHAI